MKNNERDIIRKQSGERETQTDKNSGKGISTDDGGWSGMGGLIQYIIAHGCVAAGESPMWKKL